jgi:hypothetical protein
VWGRGTQGKVKFNGPERCETAMITLLIRKKQRKRGCFFFAF